jgi:hypothetical protein
VEERTEQQQILFEYEGGVTAHHKWSLVAAFAVELQGRTAADEGG